MSGLSPLGFLHFYVVSMQMMCFSRIYVLLRYNRQAVLCTLIDRAFRICGRVNCSRPSLRRVPA